jgi:hypothetical protein
MCSGFLNFQKKSQFLPFFLKIAQNFTSVSHKPMLSVFLQQRICETVTVHHLKNFLKATYKILTKISLVFW